MKPPEISLRKKIDASTDLEIRWHLLGHLQTNKARKAVPAFAVIQSVDGVELLHCGGPQHLEVIDDPLD